MSAYELPPPPPPSELPPLPQGPPPRTFGAPSGGDSWRPPAQYPSYPQQMDYNGDSWRPPPTMNYSDQNQFSFRANENAPRYPDEKERDEAATKYKARLADNSRRPGRGNARRPYGQRQFNHRPPTAERPLLTVDGVDPSQQMLGIDQTAAQRFKATEDLSDSGEDMVESDSDAEYGPKSEKGVMLILDGIEEANMEDYSERPMKRRALPEQLSEASVPKWSNPDPYTVLPPVDESQRKKRDVVKLIRKARVAADKENITQNEVAANNDFISFGFEDEQDREEVEVRPPQVPGAPTGPRHPNQHSSYNGAMNGAVQVSADHQSHPHNGYTASMNGAPGTNGATRSIVDRVPPPGLPTRPAGLPPKPDFGLNGDTSSVPSYNGHQGVTPKTSVNPPSSGSGTLNANGSSSNQNGALGSRKRTYDDEIKVELPRPPPRKKGKGGQSNGSLSSEWVPPKGKNPTPWLVRSPLKTENPGFRLHKEICDFYDFVKPREFEQIVREDLLERVQKAIQTEMPKCKVHCFGSFAAGLYLPNADMDLVIISDSFRNYDVKVACQSNTKMHRFGAYLGTTIAESGSVEVITGAKVPIIKFVDRVTAIRVDISFENNTGIIANGTFASWKQQFPAMPILVTIIKQFLMMRGLNEVSTGGLGGFSVTCLVTSMLQNMPRVQMGEIIPEHHLGEMLIEFLDFYGNQLDIARTGINMNPPGYFDKISFARRKNGVYKADRSTRLAIIDPNQPENDISGGSKNVPLIFDRFSRAHEEIMEGLTNPKRASLLDWLLGGDYDNFVWHRNHLRKLYERKWGPVESSKALNPTAALDDSSSVADRAPARIDTSSSSKPNSKNNKKSNSNAAKVTKQPKKSKKGAKSNPQNREEIAAALKQKYPSIRNKIPAKVRRKTKFDILQQLSKKMSEADKRTFRAEMATMQKKEKAASQDAAT